MLLPSQPLDNSAPEGRNLVRLDALREIAKPFSYCGGQARRLIPVKTLLIAMSFFLLIFLGGVPLTSASGAQVVTEKDNGQEIQVKVGTTIELSLEELGSAGYSWKFDHLDKNYFDLLKTETKPVGNQPIGAPVLMTWRLKTLKVGESQLALDYFRSWEGRAKAVKHFRVKVKIE